MDNFRIEVKGTERETLSDAIAIAMRENCPGGKASHWRVRRSRIKETGRTRLVLIFFWSKPDNCVAHPMLRANRTPGDIADIAWYWLNILDDEVVGHDLDHDGQNSRGFRVFTDAHWGHVFDNSYGICAVEPIWAWHGK